MPAAEARPRYPFPQRRSYSEGTIRPNHRRQAQLDGDVRGFYERWKHDYLVPAGFADGAPMYRISSGRSKSAKTVSEGQGYGMIIVALMAGSEPLAQQLFDGLWRFARAHPSRVDPRLMAWKVPNAAGTSSAFDGDADMAKCLDGCDPIW